MKHHFDAPEGNDMRYLSGLELTSDHFELLRLLCRVWKRILST